MLITLKSQRGLEQNAANKWYLDIIIPDSCIPSSPKSIWLDTYLKKKLPLCKKCGIFCHSFTPGTMNTADSS